MVDHSPIPTPVYWSLWISAIVYTPIGLSMLFNAHFAKFTPAWAKDNQAVQLALSTYQGGYAVALLILSYVCIDALIAGSITTLEIEIEMLSVCAFAGLLFKLTSPGRLAWLVPLLKPETYLSALLLTTSYDLVRPAALCISIFFVLYGVALAIFKPAFEPFTVAHMLLQVRQADPEMAVQLKKMAGGSNKQAIPQI